MRGRKKKDILSSEFKDAIESMSVEELKEKIISLAKHEKEILDVQEEDLKLKEACALVADLRGAYKESLKYNKEQRRYALKILEGRGK